MPYPPSKKRAGRARTSDSLSLTSMMDMFTIILLFLLTSYSSEGEILAVDPNKLRLPVSTSLQKPNMRLMIQLTTEHIIVDGIPVTSINDVSNNAELLINPLFTALNKNSVKVGFIASQNTDVKFSGEVMIQGDKVIPFILLEKVMFTCGQAGYNKISLAVMSRE